MSEHTADNDARRETPREFCARQYRERRRADVSRGYRAGLRAGFVLGLAARRVIPPDRGSR